MLPAVNVSDVHARLCHLSNVPHGIHAGSGSFNLAHMGRPDGELATQDLRRQLRRNYLDVTALQDVHAPAVRSFADDEVARSGDLEVEGEQQRADEDAVLPLKNGINTNDPCRCCCCCCCCCCSDVMDQRRSPRWMTT